jgi:hypothetical protein
MDETTVKLLAGIGCLVLVGIIIMRRKAKKKTTAAEDDF